MAVSLKPDLRFPAPGQQGHGRRITQIGNISWTNKPYKGFFGRFWHESHNIEINRVLNSKDVDSEVIKFLLYHEMLHKDMPYHDNAFRKEEHRYPRWEYHQNFLFDKMNRFDIREW